MASGPLYEDFAPGDVVAHRPCRTVYQWDNVLWSALTLDYTPLYLDEVYASHTEHGRPPVNPRLLMSLVIGISTRDTSINALAFLGVDHEKLLKPVYPGDTICVESEVAAARPSRSRPEAGVVTWIHRAYNQRGELVYELRRGDLVYRRGHSPWERLLRGEGGEAATPQPARGQPPAGQALWGFPSRLAKALEDFREGETLMHRLGRTVYEYDNLLTSAISLNASTLHLDREYMALHPFGSVVVQGPFVLGVGAGLASPDLSMHLAGERLEAAQLTAPVFDGDTLHAVSQVLDVEAAGDVGRVVVKTQVYKDKMRIQVAELTRTLLVYRREKSPWAMAGRR